MRSKRQPTLKVSFVNNGQSLPNYIGLIHRHFEKAMPVVVSKKEATLNAPIDLLDHVMDKRVLDELESIELVYRKRD